MDKIQILAKANEHLLNEFPEYPELILRLLSHRKLITKQDIDHFFNDTFDNTHDPFLFNDMNKVCARIYKCVKEGKLIYLYGDYDADGICGVIILETVLKAIGAKTKVYIPHREKDGYGLSKKAVDLINQSKSELIITCDCGTSNGEEIDYATEYGIDVIVTDHHQMPDTMPNAYAIIHPKQPEETYPDKNLAGGGVAYKVVQGLLAFEECSLNTKDIEKLQKWLLDLAAISTVADMVPMIGENRIITKYGLLVLKKNKRLGLAELLSVANIDPNKITADVIGYQIAPRINAAGRMDDAMDAYKLLNSKDPAESKNLAKHVNQQNIDRQKKTVSMYNEAIGMIKENSDLAIVLHDKSWLPGLTGLVAGRLSNKFNVPVFIMTTLKDYIVGSGRSPQGTSVMKGMNHVKKDLLKFGGHTQACGFRIDPNNLSKVKEDITKYYNDHLSERDLTQIIKVDAEIEFKQLDTTTISILERFKPFGQEYPEPLFYTRKVKISSLRHVGAQAQHVKLVLNQSEITISAIAFNKSSHNLKQGDIIDIVYYSRINEWNGNKELQLIIEQLEIYE